MANAKGAPKGTIPWNKDSVRSAIGGKAAKLRAIEADREDRRRVRLIRAAARERLQRLKRRAKRARRLKLAIAATFPTHRAWTSEEARAIGLSNSGRTYRRRPLITPRLDRVGLKRSLAYKPDPTTGIAWWPDMRVWIGPEAPAVGKSNLVTLTENTAIKRLTAAGLTAPFLYRPYRRQQCRQSGDAK